MVSLHFNFQAMGANRFADVFNGFDTTPLRHAFERRVEDVKPLKRYEKHPGKAVNMRSRLDTSPTGWLDVMTLSTGNLS
jgi:hypothetical protein